MHGNGRVISQEADSPATGLHSNTAGHSNTCVKVEERFSHVTFITGHDPQDAQPGSDAHLQKQTSSTETAGQTHDVPSVHLLKQQVDADVWVRWQEVRVLLSFTGHREAELRLTSSSAAALFQPPLVPPNVSH